MNRDIKLYQEELLKHYRNPYNKQELKNPDIKGNAINPICSDSVQIYGLINNKKLTKINFTGSGCIISQATTSMLAQKYEGYSLQDVNKLNQNDILNLINLSLGPNRLKCAMLPLIALQKAIKPYL